MGNEQEQELGQFGSVTGPTKALEMLNDGSSFESAQACRRFQSRVDVEMVDILVELTQESATK
jgi:hypothetical protein